MKTFINFILQEKKLTSLDTIGCLIEFRSIGVIFPTLNICIFLTFFSLYEKKSLPLIRYKSL